MSDVFDVDSADKDALEAYAMKAFNRNLDKRKKIDVLRNEVRGLQSGSVQKAEAAAENEAAEAEAKKTRTPKFVRHIHNGFIFPWHDLYAGNAELEVIEWQE